MIERLQQNWVYGGLLSGLLLLTLTPVLATGWSRVEVLTFLALPIYMLHQYEEHDADRFRIWVNTNLGGGTEIMSPAFVFTVNFFGVWMLMSAVIWLTFLVDAGWGLFAAYLLIVNGLIHIAQAIAMRRSNPGLITAVLLFLPLGGMLLSELMHAGIVQHLISLALILTLHLAIVLAAAANLRRA